MKNLKGKVAAVTGAGSGIGRMLAINLAEAGCHLAISDINGQSLKETAGMLKEKSINVSTHIVDVADRTRVQRYAKDTVKKHKQVDIVINNAGVAVADSLEDVSYEDFEWVMNIVFWGVVYGTKAFLPYLKNQPEGHIVNISSVNGFLPFPYNGPYCAAKYAVKGFTETLAQELQGTGIGVTCVHPGGIKTNIAQHSRLRKIGDLKIEQEEAEKMFDRITITTADKAARTIIRGIRKNQRRVLVGPDAYVFDLMTRLLPVGSARGIGYIAHKFI